MKFLFLQVDKNLNWTKDADNLITTLSGAYCAVNYMCHITSIDTVKFIWPIFTWL
jgi:DNA polymerase III alpha subunit